MLIEEQHQLPAALLQFAKWNTAKKKKQQKKTHSGTASFVASPEIIALCLQP